MNGEEYLLSESEYKRCKEEILFELLLEGERATFPEVTFVVGQPGAGKTGLSIWSKREVEENSRKCVELNADKIATYHKHYNKLLDLLPEDRLKISREFVNPCYKELQDIMIEKRFNMVMECTLNSSKKIAMMEQLKNLGYKVNINVLAVDYFESFLSCFEREAEMLKLDIKPRGIDKKNHDDCYYNMLETINKIQEKGCFDKISVFKRGQDVFEPIKIGEIIQNKEDTVHLIEDERNMQRQQLLGQGHQYIERIRNTKKIFQMLGKAPILTKRALEDIEGLEKLFENEVEKNERNEDSFII